MYKRPGARNLCGRKPVPSPIWDSLGDVQLLCGIRPKLAVRYPSRNPGLLATNHSCLPACLIAPNPSACLLAWSALLCTLAGLIAPALPPCRPDHPCFVPPAGPIAPKRLCLRPWPKPQSGLPLREVIWQVRGRGCPHYPATATTAGLSLSPSQPPTAAWAWALPSHASVLCSRCSLSGRSSRKHPL